MPGRRTAAAGLHPHEQMTAPIPVLVLAGSRPGRDPLLANTDLPTKALLPIAGRPMLAHVLGALQTTEGIGRIRVVAQDTAPVKTAIGSEGVEWHSASGSIADAVLAALEWAGGPLLVTTADNVLLTPGILSQFLHDSGSADVAVALVERRRVEAAGYSTARTWLRFRGGSWSGANLFRIEGKQVAPLIEFWRAIEQDRKKGMKLVGAFGPGLLMAAALRLIDVRSFARKAAARFGLSAAIVSLDAAEACIDADKPSDLPVIETILANRQASASTSSTAASASANSSS